ncbi:ATP-binding protein, partial [Ktedonospora formicarum]|uniref:ATP-binding protein n=1 Tax=Ktedonospora formicarum TaxID=2778364 RepID=UPI001C692B08
LHELPPNTKTFFAMPLLASKVSAQRGGSLLRGSLGMSQKDDQERNIIGIVLGAYRTPWKLRKSELVLMQVLATQAGAALENMLLMTEVIEARNEARKLLRQVLEDQRLKEMILESIPSGLMTTNSDGRITTFNRAASAILGCHAREVLGQPLTSVLDICSLQTSAPAVPTVNTETLLNVAPGINLLNEMEEAPSTTSLLEGDGTSVFVSSELHIQKVNGEVEDRLRGTLHSAPDELRSGTLKTTDRQGREIVLEVDALPLRGEENRSIGTLITFTDVTSVHRLEEEKRRLDRLATLGEMAANVAHEVRNPLASIKTSMQMIMEELTCDTQPLEPGEDTTSLVSDQAWIREESSVVLKEVERLNSIVHDLLLFARPRQLHRTPCDLCELSDRVLQFIQSQCEAAHVVVHRVYRELPPAPVDVGQMEQVLLNLYMNALQAMPEGGVLTVSCMPLAAEEALVRDAQEDVTSTLPRHLLIGQQREEPSRVPWLEIAVSDTGEGIRPEQLGRIFQPFFTTKAHGIGLGLAITRRLVEDHGGYIRVEGHYGYGATISIRLPIVSERSALAEEEIWEGGQQ